MRIKELLEITVHSDRFMFKVNADDRGTFHSAVPHRPQPQAGAVFVKLVSAHTADTNHNSLPPTP